MTTSDAEFEKVRRYIPLRASEDLSSEDAARVDACARYNRECREELAAYRRDLELLRESGSGPMPVDDLPSLWERIEPRLGPAVRHRRRPLSWVSTRQLMAACVALLILNLYFDARPGQQPARLLLTSTPANEASIAVDYSAPVASRMAPARAEPARPILGVVVEPLAADRQDADRIPLGVRVLHVLPDLAAGSAGIRPGDLLIAVNGQPIFSPPQLLEVLARSRGMPKIRVEVIRDGQAILLEVPLDRSQSKAPSLAAGRVYI